MTDRLVTPPVNMAVAIVDARTHARIDGTERDTEIELVVRSITEDAEHICGRAFISQTWRVTLDAFPDAIQLPMSPAASVLSVRYLDENGFDQALDPADYYLDKVSEPGYLIPASGRAWPATAAHANAVSVDVVCGFGADESFVPASIKGYILAKVAEHFLPTLPKSEYVIRSLDRWKVYR
ncbi:head-tail connector protein [Massilia soli]|uniref:PhiE125 gp8 family phage protein n=1 Tax=Massilia soli TaxID=2792854 RepID=A0ABS7SRA5_9BURK|nr:phage head-tail connector protein [Massilia soli]MBZ2208476.1 hypothetical protein [Massilia soli]